MGSVGIIPTSTTRIDMQERGREHGPSRSFGRYDLRTGFLLAGMYTGGVNGGPNFPFILHHFYLDIAVTKYSLTGVARQSHIFLRAISVSNLRRDFPDLANVVSIACAKSNQKPTSYRPRSKPNGRATIHRESHHNSQLWIANTALSKPRLCVSLVTDFGLIVISLHPSLCAH